MAFINSFLSYLLQAVVFVLVGGLGAGLGIFLRKRKDQKNLDSAVEAGEVQEG